MSYSWGEKTFSEDEFAEKYEEVVGEGNYDAPIYTNDKAAFSDSILAY